MGSSMHELFYPKQVVNLLRRDMVNLNRLELVSLNRREVVNLTGAPTLCTN